MEVVRKADLAESVAGKTGLQKKQASQAVDAVLECIMGTLSRGGKVALAGFGNFEVRLRKARQAKNPRTGEAIMVSESKLPAFRAGKQLKDAVK